MAMVKCALCAAQSTKMHSIAAEPLNYPDVAVLVCSMPGCDKPGLVLLRGSEAVDYRAGRRSCFPLATERHVAKVRLKPWPN